MKKQRIKSFMLFLKILLFCQIYTYHKFVVEATSKNNFPTEFDETKAGSGTGLNGSSSNSEVLVDSVLERQNRPARLLPWRSFLGKEKNKTDANEKIKNARFYGPATNCTELLRIGYTRNGFYLVKENATSSNSHVEIVDCLFQNFNRVREVKEKRLGSIALKILLKKLHKRRSAETLIAASRVDSGEIHFGKSKRPARLLPYHLFYGREKNLTEEENVPKLFYGPPTSCIDLEKLGYTLNGYYLVNGSKTSNLIEVVLCLFQLPPGNNQTAIKEERLGFIRLDRSSMIRDQQLPLKKELNNNGKEISNSTALGRRIRPAQLIPLKNLFIDVKENKFGERINSNPANCNDIGLLGYTLNGFYFVNGSHTASRLDAVFCQFKLPIGADRAIKEEKFGFVNLPVAIIKTNPTFKLGMQPRKKVNCQKAFYLKTDIGNPSCLQRNKDLPSFVCWLFCKEINKQKLQLFRFESESTPGMSKVQGCPAKANSAQQWEINISKPGQYLNATAGECFASFTPINVIDPYMDIPHLMQMMQCTTEIPNRSLIRIIVKDAQTFKLF